MMVNLTHFSHFTLSAYYDTGLLTHPYFLITSSLYVLMLMSNVFLIVLICVTRSLHEPMYLFLCSLFVNELYGSTVLFPFLLVHILTDVHTVPASLCFLQIFCVHSYCVVEIFTLAVMSYDRYQAICHPLQYHTHMSRTRVAVLIAVPWFYSFQICFIMISLSSSLTLCGNIINKVYCDNFPVVKLACSDTTARNVYGLIITFFNISVLLVLILYSYMRILKVCFSGSKQTRHKAVRTCAPHLASLLNFSIGSGFEMIQTRVDVSSELLRIFLSLYYLTCQPLFNPLMFGLNTSKIKILCKSFLSAKM